MRFEIKRFWKRELVFSYQRFFDFRKWRFVRIKNVIQKTLCVVFNFINIQRKLLNIFSFCNNVNRFVGLSFILIKDIKLRVFNLIFFVRDVVQKLRFGVEFFGIIGPNQSQLIIFFLLENLNHIINDQDFVIAFCRFVFNQFFKLYKFVFTII